MKYRVPSNLIIKSTEYEKISDNLKTMLLIIKHRTGLKQFGNNNKMQTRGRHYTNPNNLSTITLIELNIYPYLNLNHNLMLSITIVLTWIITFTLTKP